MNMYLISVLGHAEEYFNDIKTASIVKGGNKSNYYYMAMLVLNQNMKRS